MNEYNACEQAFLRGYEKAVKEFAEKAKKAIYKHSHDGVQLVLLYKDIDQVEEEMGCGK